MRYDKGWQNDKRIFNRNKISARLYHEIWVAMWPTLGQIRRAGFDILDSKFKSWSELLDAYESRESEEV